MAQQTGRQYDDDLTVGVNEYDKSFSTDFVDLFEPLSDDDAPIAKLKTIVLSIDWEITDDILHQLNDELQDLKDVWAGNKINLIYIQALEKLGRYISVEKANSHPNAIKLLLAFYYDLEKIVSSVSMSEDEKKRLLLQDVKKFEQFKNQIAPGAKDVKEAAVSPIAVKTPAPPVENIPAASGQQSSVLTNLKAIVLGIDWEISDSELVRLGNEVSKLEKIFSESKAKLIFLQGIGALGNYIRSTKSSANPDAFKLLHSFYAGLEKICREVLSQEQEKKILLAEVKKFNDFKAVIATVASEVVVPAESSAALQTQDEEVEEEEGEGETGVITPAFADMPEDVRGFREDAETAKADIDKRVASFLGEQEVAADQFVEGGMASQSAPEHLEVSSKLNALFGEGEEPELSDEAAEIALMGVDVETEADDDSDEKALPFHAGQLAPALAEVGGQSLFAEQAPVKEEPIATTVAPSPPPVIPGVDVETEADDESEEAALPRDAGGVAPALGFTDEKYGFREAEVTVEADEEEFDLEDRLDSFFGAEIEEASQGSVVNVGGGTREEVPPEAAVTEDFSLTEVQEPAGVPFAEEEESSPESLVDLLELESEEGAVEEESVLPVAPAPEVPEDVTAEILPETPVIGSGEESLLYAEPEAVEEQAAAQGVELSVDFEAGEELPAATASAEEFSLPETQEAEEGVSFTEEETEPEELLDFMGLESEEESVLPFAPAPEVSEEVLAESQPATPEIASGDESLLYVEPEAAEEPAAEGGEVAFGLESGEDLLAEAASAEEFPLPETQEAEEGISLTEEEAGPEESSLVVEPDFAEDRERAVAESLAETETVESVPAGFTFEGVGAGVSVDVTGESREVVFEPVADDSEVDELPVLGRTKIAEEEYLSELRKCVDAILMNKYDETFPAFYVEIDRLRQGWQTQYVKSIFLQLLVIVGQYIDFHRLKADSESLELLQTLCDKLEQVCRISADLDNRLVQILAQEIDKVLHWQQGLISALTPKQEATNDWADFSSNE